ncbi:hypothetical protein AVEN_246903-1 [Araneus ventricosus]|uniref:Uncharacterized protein n=1 Tax=Araneus ventricosus TaxID=182803 RepID=A0A4Y2PJT5_ARAVE|nr:hypothetical protein AVEN_246903-1 [Araneus ventricosus]
MFPECSDKIRHKCASRHSANQYNNNRAINFSFSKSCDTALPPTVQWKSHVVMATEPQVVFLILLLIRGEEMENSISMAYSSLFDCRIHNFLSDSGCHICRKRKGAVGCTATSSWYIPSIAESKMAV